MSQSHREALLPGTDALTAGTVEWTRNSRGWLVRYRTITGMTYREQTRDPKEANGCFWMYVARLKQEVRERL